MIEMDKQPVSGNLGFPLLIIRGGALGTKLNLFDL
jgi:hypothetical protein